MLLNVNADECGLFPINKQINKCLKRRDMLDNFVLRFTCWPPGVTHHSSIPCFILYMPWNWHACCRNLAKYHRIEKKRKGKRWHIYCKSPSAMYVWKYLFMFVFVFSMFLFLGEGDSEDISSLWGRIQGSGLNLVFSTLWCDHSEVCLGIHEQFPFAHKKE